MLEKFRQSLKNRPASSYGAREPRKGQSCNGTMRLNKSSFLSSIGAKIYSGANFKVVSIAEQKLNELLTVLEENEMDWGRAAASLGISPSVLRKRYNSVLSVVESATINDEPASPTPERRYFENLSRPWVITSFDPDSREVCIEVEGDSIVAHISSILPLP